MTPEEQRLVAFARYTKTKPEIDPLYQQREAMGQRLCEKIQALRNSPRGGFMTYSEGYLQNLVNGYNDANLRLMNKIDEVNSHAREAGESEVSLSIAG